jgi:hypothetical protein
MTTSDPSSDPSGSHFRRTLARVLAVQAVALLLLWLLQVRYAG